MKRRGMVLIIVAIVMALVSLAAMGFLVSMKTENRAAHLQADQLQVQQVAASGTEFLQTLAQLSRAARSAWGPLQDNPDLFRDVPVDVAPGGRRRGRFCVLAPHYADESAEPVFYFGMQDTSARLALATILQWDQQEPGRGRLALMNLPGMTESTADAILDWIDQDDEPRELGVEAEFYLGLDPPRQPPNQIPQRLDDLLAVRGVTAWQLWGKQEGPFAIASAAGQNLPLGDSMPEIRATESADVRSTLPPAPPWTYFLTTHSGERNEDYEGQPRIDLNQDDMAALQTALSAAFDQELARFVIAYRQYGPATRDLERAADEPIPNIVVSQPARFRLETPLDLVDAVVELPDPTSEEENATKAYASPFRQQRPASLTRLVEFCDRTTTQPEPVLGGRVNLQRAPRPVLLGIPGLTPDQVDQILTARGGTAVEGKAREHPVWLLAEGVVELDTMKQIWPWVSVGGDIFYAQVVAFYDAQSPWHRQEIVVDGTSRARAPLYYRDLRRRGLGFRWPELVPASTIEPGATDGPASPFANRSAADRSSPATP